MSFTAIAKTVGERWQLLAPGDKDKYEREAAANKDIYYAQMNEYKKTPQYAEYQEYLAQFHGKQSGSQQG